MGVYVDEGAGERLHVLTVYGEFLGAGADDIYARGRVWRQYDGAGRLATVYDFKGNVVSSERTILDDVDTEVDWDDLTAETTEGGLDTADAGALSDVFTTTATFDALNRVVTSTTPDDSVTRNTWDEGGHLAAVDVQVRGDITWTPMVVSLEHDAKGQRTRIEYPGFATDSTYDPETFRLVRLETVRDSDDAVLQDLTYTYDAAGNIVQISDAAQQTLFFDNSVVSPTTKYTYDALYRLVSAEGREHGSLAQPGHGDPAQGDLPHDNDGSAVRTYLETYVYDEVGNILRMKHQGGTEASPGTVFWHRGYLYATGSNVLLKTSLPGDDLEDPDTYSATAYAVNDRGALVEMPHLAAILRQFDDQMRSVDLGGGDEAVYHYDAAGQRVRKVVRQGANTNERLYVGAWERFQRTTTTLQDERDTLHVMDDRRRIVMVETLTVDGGSVVSTPVPRQRFQLGNHLDSAALEVDEAGELLTFEEYHPYGTTAWWASNSALVSQKRYRYTGMERDEETGLQRHGVRGYAPWLGRWARSDPIGLKGGINRWVYCGASPIGLSDRSGMSPPDRSGAVFTRMAGDYMRSVASAQSEDEVRVIMRAMYDAAGVTVVEEVHGRFIDTATGQFVQSPIEIGKPDFMYRDGAGVVHLDEAKGFGGGLTANQEIYHPKLQSGEWAFVPSNSEKAGALGLIDPKSGNVMAVNLAGRVSVVTEADASLTTFIGRFRLQPWAITRWARSARAVTLRVACEIAVSTILLGRVVAGRRCA